MWSTRFCCRPFPFIFSRQLSGLRGSTMVHTHSSSHPTPSASPVSSSPRTTVASTPSKRTTSSAVPLQQTASRSRFSLMDSRPSSPDRPHLQPNRALSPLSVSPLTKRPSRGLHPTVREARCHRGRRPVGQPGTAARARMIAPRIHARPASPWRARGSNCAVSPRRGRRPCAPWPLRAQLKPSRAGRPAYPLIISSFLPARP